MDPVATLLLRPEGPEDSAGVVVIDGCAALLAQVWWVDPQAIRWFYVLLSWRLPVAPPGFSTVLITELAPHVVGNHPQINRFPLIINDVPRPNNKYSGGSKIICC